MTTSKIITDNDTKNEEMRFLRYSPVCPFHAKTPGVHKTFVFADYYFLFHINLSRQAPGAEGAASPAEGRAEGPAAAQQQAPAAEGTDLPPLRTRDHGEFGDTLQVQRHPTKCVCVSLQAAADGPLCPVTSSSFRIRRWSTPDLVLVGQEDVA